MNTDAATYIAILLIATVVYFTRVVGGEVMAFVRMTPRIEAFLKAMALSVLVAIVAGEVSNGDLRASTAAVAAAGIMLLSKSAIWAMTGGLALAAAWTWLAH